MHTIVLIVRALCAIALSGLAAASFYVAFLTAVRGGEGGSIPIAIAGAAVTAIYLLVRRTPPAGKP